MNQEIQDFVEQFRSISLSEMDGVTLMNRSDTKFILLISEVNGVLKSVLNDYHILEIDSERIMTYNSLYFDTPTFDFYNWHHNGKVNRLKIRIRNYVESKIYFLEIKSKNGKGITKKDRIRINGFEENLSKLSGDFVAKITNQNLNLKPTLENEFKRLTLVNKALKERATIDFNLNFKNEHQNKYLDNLAIIEIKQEGVNRSSPIYSALKAQQVRPYSISKYCIGMVSLYSNLKSNAFKSKLLKIQKLTT